MPFSWGFNVCALTGLQILKDYQGIPSTQYIERDEELSLP